MQLLFHEVKKIQKLLMVLLKKVFKNLFFFVSWQEKGEFKLYNKKNKYNPNHT